MPQYSLARYSIEGKDREIIGILLIIETVSVLSRMYHHVYSTVNTGQRWIHTWHCHLVRFMAHSGVCNRHFHAREGLALDWTGITAPRPVAGGGHITGGERGAAIVDRGARLRARGKVLGLLPWAVRLRSPREGEGDAGRDAGRDAGKRRVGAIDSGNREAEHRWWGGGRGLGVLLQQCIYA